MTPLIIFRGRQKITIIVNADDHPMSLFCSQLSHWFLHVMLPVLGAVDFLIQEWIAMQDGFQVS